MGNRGKLRFLFESTIFAVCLVLLFIGGTLITESSQELSLLLGLPLFIIGIIIAVGTCLPEMAFAIRSCTKKHCELGRVTFRQCSADSMLTIGIIALIQPIKPTFPLPPLTTGIFMVVTALVVYLLSKDGELDRKDGILLLSIYIVFLLAQSIIEGFLT